MTCYSIQHVLLPIQDVHCREDLLDKAATKGSLQALRTLLWILREQLNVTDQVRHTRSLLAGACDAPVVMHSCNCMAQ